MKRAALIFVAGIASSAPLWYTEAGATGAKACVADLASCPMNGCAKAGGAEAVMNKLKRTVPTGSTAKLLTISDFEKLQEQADSLVGEKKDLSAQQRRKLKVLKVSSGDVSEGDLVQVKGYVIAEHGLPHPNTSGESVNCRLKGAANNDFHIPIATEPSDTIYEGIVVEMIPQDRSDQWTIAKLKRVAKETRPVLVRGQLLYDSKHLVNSNPAEQIGGQPARMSLWEVHPITAFLVCKTSDPKCDPRDPSQWDTLEDYGQR